VNELNRLSHIIGIWCFFREPGWFSPGIPAADFYRWPDRPRPVLPRCMGRQEGRKAWGVFKSPTL